MRLRQRTFKGRHEDEALERKSTRSGLGAGHLGRFAFQRIVLKTPERLGRYAAAVDCGPRRPVPTKVVCSTHDSNAQDKHNHNLQKQGIPVRVPEWTYRVRGKKKGDIDFRGAVCSNSTHSGHVESHGGTVFR